MIMYIFSNTIQIYNKEQHQRGIIIDFHKGRHMGGGYLSEVSIFCIHK